MAFDALAYDRQRKAAQRASQRLQIIPRCKDPLRRAQLEADDCEWLRFYLPRVFYNPFTDDQKQLIADAAQTLFYGTSKCRAASRGGGKSSITKYLAMKYSLARKVAFALLLCATGPKASGSLDAIKNQLRCREQSPLYQDYPLECHLANYVAAAPAKVNNLTMRWADDDAAHPVRMEWNSDSLILPTLADLEDGVGPIIATMGITSDQLQGCNMYDVRPDWVMLDDLDSRDSLASADGTVADKLETIIDQNVAGVGGPGRRMGQIFLCTIPSRRSVAFKYSDPQQKPAWGGVRIAAIKEWPQRADLWERYIELRQLGKASCNDPFGREAHRFYADNRVEMEAGAVVSNPYDLEEDILPDGSKRHLSALQKLYDYIADKGMPSFLTEHQNDPPADEDITKAGINEKLVQERLSGLNRGELPPDCCIMIAVDIGKFACHWVAMAVRKSGIANIVQYGVIEVNGTEDTENKVEINRAILRALIGWKQQLDSNPFRDSNNNPIAPARILIDSGAFTDAVYDFVSRTGAPCFAIKGQSPFTHGSHSRTRSVGNHWFSQRIPKTGIRLFTLDADYWKREVHNRFIAEPIIDGRPAPGSLTLFNPVRDRDHFTFAKHILAEEWVTEFQTGKRGEKQFWYRHRAANHYFDATAYCLAAAEMAGYGLFEKVQAAPIASGSWFAQSRSRVA